MSPHESISIATMKTGESATVVGVLGGRGMVARLEALGIRPGSKITKISSMFWRGPVTVVVNRSRIAIGHGMASKIMVKRDNP